MAWTAPMTFVAGAVLTAAQLNTYLRDNLAETGPAKTSTAGGYMAGSGTNSMAERFVGHGYVGTSETTAATSFGDLTTDGPSSTVAASNRSIWLVQCSMSNATVNAVTYMGVDLSGATTVSASTAACLRNTSSTANAAVQASYAAFSSLSPGSTTFTAKYAVTAGTGTFAFRRVIVFPY